MPWLWPVAPVYEDGEKTVTLKGERIAEEFQELVEKYVARRFARRDTSPQLQDITHHPDIECGWGYCRIRFQTHAIGGLHESDFICAAKIDHIQG